MLAGTNITSVISTAISNAFTTFLSTSGQVLKTVVYQPQTYTLLTNSISGTTGATILNPYYTCKSNNSQLYIQFDATWGIGGTGTDNWRSLITIAGVGGANTTEYTIALKDTKLGGQDNRNCSISLFPLSGAFSNTASFSGTYQFRIKTNATSSDDTLTIGSNYVCTITEIQN